MSHNGRSGNSADGAIERRLARLIGDADRLAGDGEQRREPLVERAESRGVARAEAERAYDVAVEEGLKPAFGMALVMEGISVRQLGDGGMPARASEAEEPEWIDTPPSPDKAGRERRLRETFRRLRGFMERESSARRAVSAFAREPDLETFDY